LGHKKDTHTSIKLTKLFATKRYLKEIKTAVTSLHNKRLQKLQTLALVILYEKRVFATHGKGRRYIVNWHRGNLKCPLTKDGGQ
jgi:hypothetical protein